MTEEQKAELREAALRLKEIGIIFNYSKSIAAQKAFEKAASPNAVLSLFAEIEELNNRISEHREYYEGVIADGGKRIVSLQEQLKNMPGVSDEH